MIAVLTALMWAAADPAVAVITGLGGALFGGVLVEIIRRPNSNAQVAIGGFESLVEQLQADNAALRNEVAALRAEVHALRQERSLWLLPPVGHDEE